MDIHIQILNNNFMSRCYKQNRVYLFSYHSNSYLPFDIYITFNNNLTVFNIQTRVRIDYTFKQDNMRSYLYLTYIVKRYFNR